MGSLHQSRRDLHGNRVAVNVGRKEREQLVEGPVCVPDLASALSFLCSFLKLQ